MNLYSIVIPTTRPRLVSDAIKSALNQTYQHTEIIVSDNSEHGCEKVVASFNDSRIKYIRASGHSNVVDHWDFAMSHASGDWHMMLCDDDAIAPGLLSYINNEIASHPDISSVSWRFASYFDGDQQDIARRNKLSIGAYTGEKTICSCNDLLRKTYSTGTGLFGIRGFTPKKEIPYLPRAIYAKITIDKFKRQTGGRLIIPSEAMLSPAIGIMMNSDFSMTIDLPMHVLGYPSDSNGAGRFFKGKDAFAKAINGMSLDFVPVKTWIILPNISADTLIRMQRMFKDQLGHYPLNWANYFLACDGALDQMDAINIDTSEYRMAYSLALATFDAKVRADVLTGRQTKNGNLRIDEKFRNKSIAILQWLTKHFRGNYQPNDRLFDTTEIGCNNVLDCAQYLGKTTSDVRGSYP